MKTLKKILLSLSFVASMAAVSTSALAESDPGRITYKPVEAIDLSIEKSKVALEAITKGSSGEEVAELIKDAADMSKEINANDKVDVARSKVTSKLKSARAHAKASSLQEAEQELRDAIKGFNDLKGLI
ncbi:MAG: hypothetical protein WAV82_02445 [Methylobacter sp.]|jgi:predicted RNase H-like HicB family nuclease